jgi:GGDEF domain-containing protein
MYRTPDTPSRELRIVEHLLTGAEAGQRSPAEDALVDPVTQLPTLHLLLKQIRSTLDERSQVGVLSLHVSPFVKLEELFGWETFDAVLRTITEMLGEIKSECLRESDSLAELSMAGSNFVFVLSPPRYNRSVSYEDLDKLRRRIQATLRAKLAERFPAEVCAQFGAFVGCVVINRDPSTSIDRLILRGLDAAYSDAFQERERELQERRQGLERLITGRTITTVYQPIVDIQEQRVLGYEAFTRGPPGDFANPEYLFKLAYETKLLWQLERLCRSKAVARMADLPRNCLLFLNVDPESLLDPELGEWSRAENLSGRVVLEVTERAGIDDYILFRRSLDLIQHLGLRVAIDDGGRHRRVCRAGGEPAHRRRGGDHGRAGGAPLHGRPLRPGLPDGPAGGRVLQSGLRPPARGVPGGGQTRGQTGPSGGHGAAPQPAVAFYAADTPRRRACLASARSRVHTGARASKPEAIRWASTQPIPVADNLCRWMNSNTSAFGASGASGSCRNGVSRSAR